MTDMTHIPPKLLHKNAADDVLLANPRPVLPAYIAAGSAAAIDGTQDGIAQLYKRQASGGYLLSHPLLDRSDAGIPLTQLTDTAASRLAKGIPHVRVDLYVINGRPYFGEMTFFSDSGFDTDLLPQTDKKWGDLISCQ